jgi:hypothetical protein
MIATADRTTDRAGIAFRATTSACFTLLALFTQVGCTTIPPVDIAARQHMLVMDTDGAVVTLDETQHATVHGTTLHRSQILSARTDPNLESELPEGLLGVLRGLHARYREVGSLDLFLFVHGGLNRYEPTIERVESQLNAIAKARSADLEARKIYPIFVVWNSAGIGSYWDHLWRIRRGAVWGLPAHLTALPYAIFDLVGTVASVPESWSVQALAPVRSFWFNCGIPCLHVAPPAHCSPLRERLVLPSRSECGSRASHLTGLAPTAIAKIVTTPIADTLGGKSWNVMLRRADLLVRSSLAYEDTESGIDGDVTIGGLDALLQLIEARLDSGQWQRDQVRITLVGHSMGAFVVNNVLRRFPALPITDIVHLAAADSLRSLEDAVYPFLRQPAPCLPGSTIFMPTRRRDSTARLGVGPMSAIGSTESPKTLPIECVFASSTTMATEFPSSMENSM